MGHIRVCDAEAAAECDLHRVCELTQHRAAEREADEKLESS